MKNKSLVSITDYSKEDYLEIIRVASEFEKIQFRTYYEDTLLLPFFEPSTRTRLSFESAVNKLGGRVIGFTDAGDIKRARANH